MFCHFYFLLLVLLTVELVSFATTTVVLWCVILSQAGASDFQHNKNTYFPVNTTDGFPFLCFSGFHGVTCFLVCFLSSVPSFPVDLLVYDVSVRLCLLHILNGLFAPLVCHLPIFRSWICIFWLHTATAGLQMILWCWMTHGWGCWVMMACSQKHATNQYCNKGKPVLFPPQMLRIQQGVDAF